ncbi:IS110 family transposase [Palleniella muris]|uniref:IS110 family transposase n=1 Tax=Palleniella muris TaxID=3038145 RepID=UPI0030CA44A7
MLYIGIDISKATFVAAFPAKNGYMTETFTNDTKGIRKFIGKLSAGMHHCVMEATGNYCFLLLYLLERAGITASLVNPKKIKNCSRVMMSVTKTDEKDARLIADFGKKMHPATYKFHSDSLMLPTQLSLQGMLPAIETTWQIRETCYGCRSQQAHKAGVCSCHVQ